MLEWINVPTASALLVVVVISLLYWHGRPKKAAPGPRGLPVVGVIPFLGSYPERKLAKWGKAYGPIMSVRFGRQDWIVLNNYDAIYQALVKQGEVFSGRPTIPMFDEMTKGNGLGSLDYGQKWKSQRKFGLMTLRGLGMGKRSMEERVLEEAEYMNDEIRKYIGKPFSLQEILSNSVSNVICAVVFGQRFDYNDQRFNSLLRILEKWFNDPKTNILLTMLIFVPWLAHFPPFSGVMKDLKNDFGHMLDVMETEVNEHKSTFQKNDLRDFIDAFLAEMSEDKDDFTQLQLLHYIRDLFEAGSGTTANTLRWAILCLIHFPETQDKLFNEIKTVVGGNGKISILVQKDMPYTSAFIHELNRYRTLVPLGVPHCASNDTELAGFKVSKGTQVVPNIWAVHNDSDIWDQPNMFRPERHLDANGSFVKSNYVIPFSVGPRHCLGEQLAKTELFCFLTSMVQKFEFLPEPGKLPNIEKGSNGNIFTPSPYNVMARER